MQVTYDNQPADAIRAGDTVTLSSGESFTAYSDAELDQWGEYNVLTNGKWRAFSANDRVTLTYTEDYDYNMV